MSTILLMFRAGKCCYFFYILLAPNEANNFLVFVLGTCLSFESIELLRVEDFYVRTLFNIFNHIGKT